MGIQANGDVTVFQICARFSIFGPVQTRRHLAARDTSGCASRVYGTCKQGWRARDLRWSPPSLSSNVPVLARALDFPPAFLLAVSSSLEVGLRQARCQTPWNPLLSTSSGAMCRALPRFHVLPWLSLTYSIE